VSSEWFLNFKICTHYSPLTTHCSLLTTHYKYNISYFYA
jgi:hypothetical protein